MTIVLAADEQSLFIIRIMHSLPKIITESRADMDEIKRSLARLVWNFEEEMKAKHENAMAETKQLPAEWPEKE